MSDFGLKYFAGFRSKYKGVYWRVEIEERGYNGGSEEMEFAGDNPQRITWENRGDEFFVPVKASEASITVMCRENFHYIGLFTSDPRKFRVSIYRNTVLYWRGFVVADLYSESFTAPPYEVTVKAVDGFKLLSGVSFLNADQSRWSGRVSLWEVLSSCISLLELDLSVSDWMDLYPEGASEDESPLRQVFVDMERFYYVYENPTFRDALELCLRPFAGQIFQSGGSLHIRRAVSLYNDNRPLSFYDVGAEFPSGWLTTADGQTIVTSAGEPIITTMSRDRIDSMWDADINVLGDSSSLEIVPAVRKVDVSVKGKLMANLIDHMGIYDIDKWDDLGSGLLTLRSKDTLSLKGSRDHQGEVYYHSGYAVKKSAYKMNFGVKLHSSVSHRYAGATSSTQPRDTSERHISVEYGFRLTSDGNGTVYYLDEDGSWQSEKVTVKDDVGTSNGAERKIEMEGFPENGLLQMFIVQTLGGYSLPRESFWQSASFGEMSLTLDTDDDYDNESSYSLSVNAANNTDLDIQLPIADIPNIPNDRLIYSLYFVDKDGEPTRMWHGRGQTDYNSLVGHLMACALRYKQLPAKRISGEMFTGQHIDMNTVVQDDKYLKAGFYINSIELDSLEDTYNSELVEMPQLLVGEASAEGDDCVLLASLPFSVRESVKCANQIVMLTTGNELYTYDTITHALRNVGSCSAGARLYPADDSFVISDENKVTVIDYRGSVIRTVETGYQSPATYMGGEVYGVARYNVGRGGSTSWSYYFGILGRKVESNGGVRVSGSVDTSGSTSFGTSHGIDGIVKSYSSIVMNAEAGAYLYDRRVNKGLSTTLFSGARILSLSDYFLCIRESGNLKLYRRDTITEQTLVRSIIYDATLCDQTLSEVAYSNGSTVRIWDYRKNFVSAVTNAGAGLSDKVKGLFFINGSLYILRQNALYKYVPTKTA